ncbi:MAG: DNA translocase FtsK 4TM domain-containing protein [Pannonibacter indicus]
MSFPLGAMRGEGLAPAPETQASGSAPRWRRQAALLAAAIAWLLYTLAMISHSPGDPGFTTSGTGETLRNHVGLLGARASDLSYFLLGFSAWWLVPVGLRAWLGGLAKLIRPAQAAASTAASWPRWGFWLR